MSDLAKGGRGECYWLRLLRYMGIQVCIQRIKIVRDGVKEISWRY